VSATITLLAAA
jgi:hypothetical protein